MSTLSYIAPATIRWRPASLEVEARTPAWITDLMYIVKNCGGAFSELSHCRGGLRKFWTRNIPALNVGVQNLVRALWASRISFMECGCPGFRLTDCAPRADRNALQGMRLTASGFFCATMEYAARLKLFSRSFDCVGFGNLMWLAANTKCYNANWSWLHYEPGIILTIRANNKKPIQNECASRAHRTLHGGSIGSGGCQ
jgi:hypothetical protein